MGTTDGSLHKEAVGFTGRTVNGTFIMHKNRINSVYGKRIALKESEHLTDFDCF